jgi:hypothetical protein
MPRTGQQLAMLMLAHLLSPFFDHAAQPITPILHEMLPSNKLELIYHRLLLVHIFLWPRLPFVPKIGKSNPLSPIDPRVGVC